MTAPSEGPKALPPQFFRHTYLLLFTVLTGIYAVVSVVAPTPWVELPLGLLTLLFVPGYALGALAFGAKPRWPWSLTFSIVVGLSVAFNVAVGLFLLAFHWGLPPPAFGFASLILLMAASLAWAATRPLETGPRFTSFLREEARLPGHNPAQRAVSYALLGGIVLALVLIVFVASVFPTPAGNLSLGLVGPGGSTANLVTNGTTAVNNSTTPTYTIYIVVGNGATTQQLTLTMLAAINPTNLTHYASVNWSSPTQGVDLANPTQCNVSLNLSASESFTQKVHFFFSAAGQWVLTFDLYDASGTALRTAGWSMSIRAA